MKTIQYRIEAFLLSLLFLGFRLLPLDLASALGALMARAIGPFFSAHKTAKKNLADAFPELKRHEIIKLTERIWANLGRNGAEYAFLKTDKLYKRINVIGAEHLPADDKRGMLFSGHIGNWELLCHVAYENRTPLTIVYRHTNNPYVDKIIADLRKTHVRDLIAKGLRGGVRILAALKRGETVAMLVDQKQNNGIAVPFFGRDAMTSPAIAELALKYDTPLIPARVIRKRGAHFDCVVYPPLAFEKTGDHKQDVLVLMTKINATLEGWIREYPDQWFWVHRRWPKPTVSS